MPVKTEINCAYETFLGVNRLSGIGIFSFDIVLYVHDSLLQWVPKFAVPSPPHIPTPLPPGGDEKICGGGGDSDGRKRK